MQQNISEFAYDLHAGLSEYQIADYDDLKLVGMAATLAIHIKGLGEIPYEVLRRVSEHFMNIPSIALEPVLRLLSEVGFVILTESGRKITAVTQNIPVFETVYGSLNDYANSECSFNEFEIASVEILRELQTAPRNRDALYNKLGMDKSVFDRTLTLTSKSGIVTEHHARGRNILISPFYFTDNLDGLADAAASVNANAMVGALGKVKDNQGWPLSLVKSRGEIGGVKLDPVELKLVEKLAAEGVIKPPTVKFGATSESFVFTPSPGKTRLSAANRGIYERAMALVSAIRKGQLIPNRYPIRSPARILEALRDRGEIAANSEAPTQYMNLVSLMLGRLVPSGSRSKFVLNKTDENRAALTVAIDLLRSGSLAGMEVDDKARHALTQNEAYVQSLVSSREMRLRQTAVQDEQATYEFNQLLLRFD